MIKKILHLIDEHLGISKSTKETDDAVALAEKITLDGEETWMLVKKKNGAKKSFDCSCTETEQREST